MFRDQVPFPNDEAASGHPLDGRGLELDRAHLVRNSEWIEEVDRANSVHPQFRPIEESGGRHYVLVFHDDTLEVIAKRVDVRVDRGNLATLLLAATRQLVKFA